MHKHTIHTVDNKVYINYPLDVSEEQVQTLIRDLKNLFFNNQLKAFELTKYISIQLDTNDIALSLLFFFKELIGSESYKESNTEIYFQPYVYDLIMNNFGKEEVFNSKRIKKVTNV